MGALSFSDSFTFEDESLEPVLEVAQDADGVNVVSAASLDSVDRESMDIDLFNSDSDSGMNVDSDTNIIQILQGEFYSLMHTHFSSTMGLSSYVFA